MNTAIYCCLNLSQPRCATGDCAADLARLGGRCWNSRRSRGGFLRSLDSRLLRGLPRSLHWRFLGSRFLCGGCLLGLGRRGSFGSDPGPTSLGGVGNGLLASGAELPLRLGSVRRDRRRRPRRLLRRCPSLSLCFANGLPASGAHLPAPALRSLRCGGGLRGTAFEHGAEFSYLGIDTELLLFKALDGGIDDFGGEFVGGHKN